MVYCIIFPSPRAFSREFYFFKEVGLKKILGHLGIFFYCRFPNLDFVLGWVVFSHVAGIFPWGALLEVVICWWSLRVVDVAKSCNVWSDIGEFPLRLISVGISLFQRGLVLGLFLGGVSSGCYLGIIVSILFPCGVECWCNATNTRRSLPP